MKSLLIDVINERQFAADLEKCKEISEFHGFTDAVCGDVLLLDCESLKHTKILGGTTISDIEGICACNHTLTYCNTFCGIVKEFDSGEDMAFLIQIRTPTKRDLQEMRPRFRYVPPRTKIASIILFWRGEISGLELPFIQNESYTKLKDGELDGHSIRFLDADARFSKRKNTKSADTGDWGYAHAIQSYIELIPDISSEYFALNKVGDITFWIPISRKSTKTAFKHRDKNRDRRSPLMYEVKKFHRRDGVEVDAHARGSCEFSMNGKCFEIIGGAEVASRVYDIATEKGRRRFLSHVNRTSDIKRV